MMKNLQLLKVCFSFVKKTFKCNKSVAATTFDWFNLWIKIKIKMDNLFWIGCIVLILILYIKD
jgi:hypothetical protein